MIGGLRIAQESAGEESDDPGDSVSLALIEQILLHGDLVKNSFVNAEIKKEVNQAIETALDDEESEEFESIEKTVQDEDNLVSPSSDSVFYNSNTNIASYWHNADSDSLHTYYQDDISSEYVQSDSANIAEETKQFNTAVKENYNARIKNEIGMDMEDSDLSQEEKERSFTFKIMNPSLWKFMYEASSCLVSGKMTTY